MRFDPARISIHHSLNRAVLVDLPALPLPDSMKGKTGYQLLSSQALDELIAISGFEADRTLFFRALEDGNPKADAIMREVGRRFGWFLLMLQRGDAINRQARDEWDASYWDYWHQVRHVFVGGGIVSGRAGVLVRDSALSIISAYLPDYVLTIAPFPRQLPLLGASRIVNQGDSAYVLDFGSTYVKRGLASFEDDALVSLRLLEPIPIDFPLGVEQDKAHKIFERVGAIICETLTKDSSPIVPVSLSAYVTPEGQPIITQSGTYMHMATLYDDVQTAMSQWVSARVGYRVQVRFLHDGTAAATFYAPQQLSAVIMMGTALGIGFPALRPNLRAVRDAITVSDEHAG